MKCVINTKTNEVRRINEEQASELVKKGPWEFTSKENWKKSPDTTWKASSVPANPMSENKKRRIEIRNNSAKHYGDKKK